MSKAWPTLPPSHMPRLLTLYLEDRGRPSLVQGVVDALVDGGLPRMEGSLLANPQEDGPCPLEDHIYGATCPRCHVEPVLPWEDSPLYRDYVRSHTPKRKALPVELL